MENNVPFWPYGEREIDNFGYCGSEFGENPGGSGPTTQEEAEPKICAAHPLGPIWNYPVNTGGITAPNQPRSFRVTE